MKIAMPYIGALLLLRVAVAASAQDASQGSSQNGPQGSAPTALQRLAVPATGAYTGAYVEFGDYEDEVTLDKIESFNERVCKRQAIVAFSNYWGRGRFPTAQARIVVDAGAVPLVFWNPWDSQEDTKHTRFDIAAIAAGRFDDYIDAWGRDARAFGAPLLVAWGLEMNGNWFPWSGVFHGADEPVPGTDPPLLRGPEAFKRAYRHVVDRVRAAGAANISWVFQTIPQIPWNRMAVYYPGSAYVDWLAVSAYGMQFPGEGWHTVKASIVDPYAELAAIDPSKPVLYAEWGVGEFPQDGDKGQWIGGALSAMALEMPRLKGAVFWHERWPNGGSSYSNLRVDSSPGALTAYRTGVAPPFWLAEPIREPAVAAAPRIADPGQPDTGLAKASPPSERHP
jgi:hypothetical protein